MSFNFKGGTSQNFRESFRDRKEYKENAKLEGVLLLDTWYQYSNYGLLNDSFEPVILNNDEFNSSLTPFGDYTTPGLSAASFVTRAFQNFREYYVAKTQLARLDFPEFIQAAIPRSAYVDFDTAYIGYISGKINVYADLVLGEMKDFEQFEEILFSLISSNIEKFPITRSGFLLSSECPNSVSGLTIELAELQFYSDVEKSQLFNSHEFKCFAELVTSLGFYLDKNAPWRLIANLESPIMRGYILDYQPETTPENILNKTFRQKTHYEDISSIYHFYASVLSTIYSRLSLRGTPSFKQEFLISETLKIRMLETGMDMKRFATLNRQVIDLHRVYAPRFPENPLKQASGKIGKICSEKLKEIYLAKSQINSYDKTTLKDYR
jgi:hypothetical protein